MDIFFPAQHPLTTVQLQ